MTQAEQLVHDVQSCISKASAASRGADKTMYVRRAWHALRILGAMAASDPSLGDTFGEARRLVEEWEI